MRFYKGEHRSGFETTVRNFLESNMVVFAYEPYRYLYYSSSRGSLCGVCGSNDVVKARWYTPDFVIGSEEIFLEAKGRLTGSNRSSMLAMLDTCDSINRNNFRLLLQQDNTYGKVGKRYSDWCESNGIIYAISRIGEVPKEWVKEIKI